MTIFLQLGPAVSQLLLAVGYLCLRVVDFGLRLVQRVLDLDAERLIPQLRPLRCKRLKRSYVLVLGSLVLVGEVVDPVEAAAVYVSGGVAAAVVVAVKGGLVKCYKVFVRAQTPEPRVSSRPEQQ